MYSACCIQPCTLFATYSNILQHTVIPNTQPAAHSHVLFLQHALMCAPYSAQPRTISTAHTDIPSLSTQACTLPGTHACTVAAAHSHAHSTCSTQSSTQSHVPALQRDALCNTFYLQHKVIHATLQYTVTHATLQHTVIRRPCLEPEASSWVTTCDLTCALPVL